MTEPSGLLLGVDIGTSSSKGVLVRADGSIVASAERPHELSMPRPGWAEHNAETIWWADFIAVCRDLRAQHQDEIAAVAVSGIGPCLLPVDAAGLPLRPAILYGIDTRATQEIEELTERLGAQTILERGGSLLSSQAVGPKLLWLQRNEPDVWGRTRRFLMASSFIVKRLTGEYVLDHHSASQCDPLYDMRKEGWSDDWVKEIAPGLELPRLLWPAEVAGRVSASGAVATGIRAGTPVVAGTIDAWAEALSVGVREPGDTMLMYGTTMFLIQVTADSLPKANLWNTMGVYPHSRTFAAGMATSGAVTSWFRGIVGGPPYESLIQEAAATTGTHGLVLLPYFAGERSPIFDPLARGLIAGLTVRHSRGDLYRAILEGTAFSVRHNLDVMRQAGAEPKRLVAVGGGTKGGLWTQIVSDVTDHAQELPRETIGASYGDALLAGVGAGLVGPTATWNSISSVVEPNRQLWQKYDLLYGIYRTLYEQTSESMHTLASIAMSDPYEGR